MQKTVLTVKDRDEYQRLAEREGCGLPYSSDLSPLGERVAIGARFAENRIAYQAMEGCDGTPSGSPDTLTCRRYLRFARGGPGVIWLEATAVLEEGRANPRQLYLTEKNMDDFRRLCDEIRETSMRENGYAPLLILQLTHSGRYSKPHGFPEPLIAYHNPNFEAQNPLSDDRIVSDDYLKTVGEALIRGAKMAEAVGCDGADIKACHGYLLCELLSAHTRKGEFGGSFENRTRLYRTAVEGARAVTGRNFLIASRMNAYDGYAHPYGFGVKDDGSASPDLTETKALLKELHRLGLDLLDITMGNPYQNPHVNRPFARGGYEPPEAPLCGVERMLRGTRELKEALPALPIISSGITFLGTAAPHITAACIEEGWFDFAGFGRATLAYPDLAKRIAGGEEMEPNRICIACSKCTEIMRTKGGTPGCVIRDSETYLPIYQKQCT